MKAIVLAMSLVIGAGMAAAAAKPGEPAPAFELVDMAAKKFKLADFKGEVLVLEWTSAQCPFVLEHYERGTMLKLAEKYKGKVKWLAIDSSFNTSDALLYNWTMKWKIPYPILMDPSGVTGTAYGATATPHMFVIDKKGVVRYMGAIDDDASNSKKKITNYVEAALDAVLADKPVEVASTAAYGCGVKYGASPFK